jgi:hypothetical protein
MKGRGLDFNEFPLRMARNGFVKKDTNNMFRRNRWVMSVKENGKLYRIIHDL